MDPDLGRWVKSADVVMDASTNQPVVEHRPVSKIFDIELFGHHDEGAGADVGDDCFLRYRLATAEALADVPANCWRPLGPNEEPCDMVTVSSKRVSDGKELRGVLVMEATKAPKGSPGVAAFADWDGDRAIRRHCSKLNRVFPDIMTDAKQAEPNEEIRGFPAEPEQVEE
eukprot:jgi/Mesvir1/15475/Mv20015-RA.1